MLQGGILASSEIFITQQVTGIERFTDLIAFETVLEQLKAKYNA
jgi:hypothetical protein